MPSNNTSPRSKQQDIELIVRQQTDFSGGMSKDVESIEVPTPYVRDLVNARGHTDSVRGRYGTSLWSEVEMPNRSEMSNDDGSPIDIVNGNEIPCDILTAGLYYEGDRVILTHVDGIQTMVTYIISMELRNGDIYVKLSAPDGVIDDEYQTFKSARTFGPINASIYEEETDTEYYLLGEDFYAYNNFIWYKIPSHTLANKDSIIIRIERFVVLFNYNGIFSIGLFDKDNISPMIEMNGDSPALRLNRISDYVIPKVGSAYNYAYTYLNVSNHYNKNRNTLDTDDIMQAETAPAYNESDEAMILDGNEGVVPNWSYDWGTLGYSPDGNNTQFTTRYTRDRISDGWTTQAASEYNNGPTDWKKIADDGEIPFLNITVETVGGTTTAYTLRPIFSKVYTMYNLASAFDKELKMINSLFTAEWRTSGLFFNSNNNLLKIDIVVPGSTTGYDLLTEQNPTSSFPWCSEIYPPRKSGVRLEWLFYPYNRTDITHYSLYRSKNIYAHTELGGEGTNLLDPSIANNPTTMGWIDDIPVCSLIKIHYNHMTGKTTWAEDADQPFRTIYNTTQCYKTPDNFSSWNFSIGGATIIDEDEREITNILNGSTSDITGYLMYGVQEMLGVTTSSTPTVINGVDMYKITANTWNWVASTNVWGPKVDWDETDDGNTLYLEDGSYTTIIYHDGDVYIPIEVQTQAVCGYKPNGRQVYDNTTDNAQNGNLMIWPLRTLYYRPLPNPTKIAYNKSILLCMNSETPTELDYTSTAEYRGFGYYNKAYQRNTSLVRPITGITVAGDQFVIFTSESTHTVNPSQAYIEKDLSLGTAYVILPDLVFNDTVRGIPNDTRVANGPNGSVFVLTNEPALRYFDGVKYSDDFSDGTIGNTVLNHIYSTVAMAYNSRSGLTIWGAEQDE